jgi:hypothetical protein
VAPIASQAGLVGGTAISGVAGGLASVAVGGKFADGAVTAAFGYLFNACGSPHGCATLFGAFGLAVGVAASGVCDVGTAGVCAPANPSTVLATSAAGAAAGAALDTVYNSAPEVPSSVGPGPNAGTPIPAGPSPTPTADQQGQINQEGDINGCHTCGTTDPGTKSGNWVGDHQPPTALNPPGNPQVYYPQCLTCSRIQGGLVRGLQGQ